MPQIVVSISCIYHLFQGFTLEFFFEQNDFFENKKLTKEYIMRSEPEEGDPFSFEGPEIIKCHGYVYLIENALF